VPTSAAARADVAAPLLVAEPVRGALRAALEVPSVASRKGLRGARDGLHPPLALAHFADQASSMQAQAQLHS